MYAARRNGYGPFRRFLFSASLVLCVSLLFAGCVPAVSGTDEMGRSEEAAASPVPAPDAAGVLKVHFIDVGQGDSIFIQSGTETMLIDAGTNEGGPVVTAYLQALGITKLSYLIGTHPHEDHIGGLDDVIRAFDIGMVIMPDVSHTTRTYEDVLDALLEKELRVVKPNPGDTYSLGEADFTTLSPDADIAGQAAKDGDLNNLSVGIRLAFGSNAFVMCGDAEAPSEKAMVESGLSLKADVLKLSHHGSSTSTCDEFLQAVSPSYAVISCGTDNSYGHPHKETMEKLAASGISVYHTDEQGTLIATSDGSQITWETAVSSGSVGALPGTFQEAAPQSVSYVLNKNSMKFHYPDCTSVSQMKEANKIYYEGSREEITGMGYSPCSQCNP
ncbi:ComEC/Rec2 family competence protein [Eisenbergiella sp.]